MRFTKVFIAEVIDHIRRLGLTACPVCHAENSLNALRLPVMLNIGGAHHPLPDPRHDPEANVLFMVMVDCNLCGHTMLFNSDKFRDGNAPILFSGPPELEP